MIIFPLEQTAETAETRAARAPETRNLIAIHVNYVQAGEAMGHGRLRVRFNKEMLATWACRAWEALSCGLRDIQTGMHCSYDSDTQQVTGTGCCRRPEARTRQRVKRANAHSCLACQAASPSAGYTVCISHCHPQPTLQAPAPAPAPAICSQAFDPAHLWTQRGTRLRRACEYGGSGAPKHATSRTCWLLLRNDGAERGSESRSRRCTSM